MTLARQRSGGQHGRPGRHRPRGYPEGGLLDGLPARRAALLVVGDGGAMRNAARRLRGVPEPRLWRPGDAPIRPADGLAVLEIGRLGASALRPGAPSVAGAEAAYRYIVKGARMAMAGEATRWSPRRSTRNGSTARAIAFLATPSCLPN